MKLAAAAVALFGALALPRIAAACDGCLAAQDDSVQMAFLIATLFLSVTPLAMIGGFVFWLRRRAKRLQAEEAAGVVRLPLGAERNLRRL